MANYKKSNLESALNLLEEEYDRIDNDIQRMVDRTEGMLKVYILATSLLVSALSFGDVNKVSTCYKLISVFIALPINGLFLKYSLVDTIKPQEVKKLNYNLDDSGAMLTREKFSDKEEDFLEYVINGFNVLNKENKGNLKDLEKSFKKTHWSFVGAIVVNISLVLIYSVI